MVRFDAYSATTRAASSDDLLGILSGLGSFTAHASKGHHSFARRVAMKDESGTEVGSVQWGGVHGDLAMIEVKGERTPEAVEALRSRFFHKVTRVDACADFDAPGAFDGLLAPCLEVKQQYRLKGERRGDWEDFPEEGRTMYLGAPTSPSRVRLYEKGKQPEYRHLSRPDWARIEVQVRPAKEAKESFNRLAPGEVWGASRWTRDLAGRVLAQHVDPHPAGSTYRMSQRDTAVQWMCGQYGAHLASLADELGGWDCLGLTLGEMIKEGRHA